MLLNLNFIVLRSMNKNADLIPEDQRYFLRLELLNVCSS